LLLDTDFDGLITVEDVLKYLGTEKDLNYNDLKKLMMDKDSKNEGTLSYPDFSKWLGSSIHMSEGFYFRHDSTKNPQYEKVLEDAAKGHLKKDKEAAAAALNKTDMEYKILEKIKFQWKTLRKAFMDLNIDKSGNISKKELWYYLDFWGMKISQEEFEKVYASFDVDGDGVINYKDF
jgi:Ca2+-binding EF-hand superfamily protein